jgi:hypothetical protein
MTRYPTITDVVAWLRHEEQPGMAAAVERLQANYQRLRDTNERNVQEYQRLLEKHEPKPQQVAGPVWTGD